MGQLHQNKTHLTGDDSIRVAAFLYLAAGSTRLLITAVVDLHPKEKQKQTLVFFSHSKEIKYSRITPFKTHGTTTYIN